MILFLSGSTRNLVARESRRNNRQRKLELLILISVMVTGQSQTHTVRDKKNCNSLVLGSTWPDNTGKRSPFLAVSRRCCIFNKFFLKIHNLPKSKSIVGYPTYVILSNVCYVGSITWYAKTGLTLTPAFLSFWSLSHSVRPY